MKYAMSIMAAQKTGSIINVASVNGTRAGLGGHHYCAAKAALIQLTRSAAVELGKKRIRVNSISPGPIATGAFGKSAGLDPMRRTSVWSWPQPPFLRLSCLDSSLPLTWEQSKI